MMANIAKAALKIPWKKIAQTVVPVAIEHVLDRVKRRKPARERAQKPTPDVLAERVDKLEDDLEASLEAARSTSDELAVASTMSAQPRRCSPHASLSHS